VLDYTAINLQSMRIKAISSGRLTFKYDWILKNVFMKKLGD